MEKFVLDLINQDIKTLEEKLDSQDKIPKRRRLATEDLTNFWDTPWGKLIQHPDVRDPATKTGKIFRRRFRLPFPLFNHLVNLCQEHDIFETKRQSKIPIEAKVVACLRILARDHCADDIYELSHTVIGESTVYYIFKKFIHGVATKLFPIFVKFPTDEYLNRVLEVYSRLGLPGCVGIMDCTHIKWSMCPKGKRFHATGKEGYPTVSFQVAVDHERRIIHVSTYFL